MFTWMAHASRQHIFHIRVQMNFFNIMLNWHYVVVWKKSLKLVSPKSESSTMAFLSSLVASGVYGKEMILVGTISYHTRELCRKYVLSYSLVSSFKENSPIRHLLLNIYESYIHSKIDNGLSICIAEVTLNRVQRILNLLTRIIRDIFTIFTHMTLILSNHWNCTRKKRLPPV